MPEGGPQRIGEFVKQFLKRAGLDRPARESALADAWGQALGDPRLAAHVRPGTIRNGVLRAVVDSPVVLQQLSFRRREIVKRLGELAPGAGVRDVRFVVGEG
jgi:predicted nucleic acid-binding Zn ribbon protein